MENNNHAIRFERVNGVGSQGPISPCDDGSSHIIDKRLEEISGRLDDYIANCTQRLDSLERLIRQHALPRKQYRLLQDTGIRITKLDGSDYGSDDHSDHVMLKGWYLLL